MLLVTIRTSLVELEKGIKGLVVMSSDLEEVFTCIHNAQVPPLWSKAFPSLKPLGAWTRDLIVRVEQFSTWATTTHPPVLFWLSGFTFPTGFLTAVLQTAARKNNVCIAICCVQLIICISLIVHCIAFCIPHIVRECFEVVAVHGMLLIFCRCDPYWVVKR